MLIAIVVVVFFFTMLSFYSIFSLVLNKPRAINKIANIDERKTEEEIKEETKIMFLKVVGKLFPLGLLGDNKRRTIKKNLIMADSRYTIEELYAIKTILSAIVVSLVYFLTKNIINSTIIGFLSWLFPNIVVKQKAKSRMKNFNDQIVEGVTLIANSLKVGHSFMQAIVVVIANIGDPFASEFSIFLKELSLGLSTKEAFDNMMNRVESEEMSLVANAILVQQEIGGNLAMILENIIGTIRDRRKVKREIQTITAQGKLSGYIVFFLPIAISVFLFLTNPEYILLLFTTFLGRLMLGSAFLTQVIGFFIIKKIITIEF